ncbi:MucR family transcriptional regulator [Methylobacterium oxalidis]|uniref:MucR family transcriptional regulator n=3 Tax=Methylobacterium oxalidis TaxID=944322 RepID=UPI001EE1309F|nr:MucR family transcriptional regulator [Methylobacterium oxalidis]GJE31244.1 Transcriptional regulatory protein ros [Methylobacterium oxalidis]
MEPEETSSLAHDQFIELSAQVVSAYVARNHVAAADIPALIHAVHASLSGLAQPAAPPADTVEKPTPAQVRKSITPDALISFIDGKPYKTLKRHLSTHGLDPYSYRQRYGLPNDYPMVAAAYAAQRSELAKSIGLGRPGGMQEDAGPAKPRGRNKAA